VKNLNSILQADWGTRNRADMQDSGPSASSDRPVLYLADVCHL